MNLRFWLTKTRIWLRNLLTARVRNHRRNRAFTQARSPFAEFLEPRLLLTGGHTGSTSDPGEFYYSLASASYVYDSDYSRTWVDDSDIMKLTIEPNGSWQHEFFFDGSDVGLTTGEEDIDAFAIRDDGTILISTSGCVNVAGVSHAAGGDLLRFTPTSTGRHTAGTWEMYVDGSDVGISHWENIDAVSELPDGRLVISTQNNAKLNGLNSVRAQDLSVLTLSRTGNYTQGTWQRYLDGSDIGLTSSSEDIDAVSVGGDGSTIHLSTLGTAYVSGPRAYDEDVFTFEASHLGSYTSGSYRNKLTLNASHAGIPSSNDIDAFHAAAADPSNPQSPVIEDIGNKTIDELMELSFTPTATDPDTPVGDLEWSLTSGPSAASVNASTGRFSWTPTEADGPGSFDVTLTVSDGGRSDSETFTITVAEVNTAPELSAIGNQIINEGATVSFDANATDVDLPANTLTYSISGDVPTGSTFNSTTGQFSWDTTTAHGGNSYDVTVTVSDGQLSDSESFTITVNNVGDGLAIEPIDDQSIDELVPFSYQVVATGSSSDGLLNLDFETAADGATLSSGDVIAEQFAAMGIHITSHDPANHPPMIFDSSNPTGGDRDLGTPNSRFGGPGIGNGGKSGRWKNDVARENILIISEDGDSQDPDDRARGGRLILTFDTPTAIDEIGLLDVDSGRNTIYLYDAAGRRISKVNIPRRGDNSHQVLALNAEGVSRLELVLCGSGAITDLIFDRDGTPPTGGGPLTYALAPGAPAGMTISDTGLIEWTPTEAQGPSVYDVTVEVSDGASTVTETFTVTVAEVNVAPVITPINDQTIDELADFSYQVVASDADLPENTLTYSLATGAPDGMTISNTGLIEWTPTELQGPGIYPVTVEVSDGTVTVAEDFQMTVGEVNLAPVITPINDQAIDELADFGYQVVASDADLPENTLTYSLATGAPTGMTISDTGLIEWTPTEAQGPGAYEVTVEVSDGTATVTEAFTVTVDEVNAAPVITPINDQTIDELADFSYQVVASDADLPENTLTYSLATGAPTGMTISDTGLIEWMPTEAQGPGVYDVTVEVSDGTATVTEAFTVTVGEVNVAPVITPIDDVTIDELSDFSYQVVASDADLPANTLTYSLATGAPTGMNISDTGLITWTPTEAQGPDNFDITVEVSDGTVTSTEPFRITVGEVNVAPVITPIADQTIDELSPFSLPVQVTDVDLPTNALDFSLASGAPAGMTISASGVIEWTPTEEQGLDDYPVTVEVSDGQVTVTESFVLTVAEVNVAPVLAEIANQDVDEEAEFSLQTIATDSDIPANTLTYSLTGTPPSGIAIDSNGLLTWTPTETQGPGTYAITVEVSDGELTDSKTFQIEVAEVNQPPVIEEILDIAFNEHSAWTLQVEANDPDLPVNDLTYDLVGTVPAGMGIDTDGLISWTPTEAQGPASYTVNVEVSDGSLTDVETFNIMVNELNQDPALAPIGNRTVVAGESLTFTAAATDGDIPVNNLVYSITGDVPAAATFNSVTGEFVWNSSTTDTPGDLAMTVTVDDQAGGTDSETFTITVQPPATSSITLTEDDRFQTTATQSITVPAEASYFEFEILNLSFDTDATGKISDAFEVALLDADGNSLVHTVSADRDSYFNISEPGTEAAAANTIVSGAIVRVDLSHIPPGTAATVVYRLVNNDNAAGNDTATTVTVSEGTVIAGDLNTSAGAAALQQNEATGPVDLTTLTDVTGSFSIEYAQTSFNNDTSTLFADVWLTNNANQPIDGPFIIVVENLTDPLVAATDFDGRTNDGNPYYIVEDLSDSGSIQPHATTLAQTLTFFNPNNTPFDYELTVLAAPNEAPIFTSTPITLVEAGRPYSYDSNADDPDGDTLTYELLAGPEGMTIDSATGEITWSPETGDEGNHSVVIKASDGRGAFDEQQFTVEVRDLVPNRPPVIISSPVTQTTLFGATPQVNIPTTIGVWNATRAGIDLNFDTGTELEDLRDDLSASFPNGTLIGTSRLGDEFLSGVDVLALHAAASGFTEISPLTAAEQTALFNFVRDGGSAILLPDNDGDFAAFSDSILAPFGMDTSGVISFLNRADITAPEHPIFKGPFGEVTGFDTWFPSQIVNFGAYATSVAALSGNRSVGAVIEPGAIAEGSGGVVVFSDTISGYPDVPGDQAERTRLFKNSLAWLGGSNLTREVTPVTIAEYVELTPSDLGSTSTTTFSTLPSDDASVFGAEFANAQSVNFDVDPFGNPIPSGTFITTQYESLGLVMNNFQVSNSVYGGPASSPNATTTPAVPGETLEFQFVVPVVAVGFINTSPDQDEIEFLDSKGEIIFSTRDQNAEVGPDFDTDRFVGAVADPSRPIHAVRVINADPNGSGRLELDELLFVPAQATYEYQVEALDPDFDPIRYQLDEAPSGMIVNAATGLISWAPGADDVGTHTVRVTAADGRGGTATQEYQLVVLADPTNTAPVIISDPVDSFFIPGFSNPASGDVTPQRISLDLGNGETFDGTVSITLPAEAGRFADIVLAVDESGSMGGDQAWVADMIPLLDNALKAQGIGDTVQNPNRFAIVGFGGGRDGITVGHFLNQDKPTKYTLYGPSSEVVATGSYNQVVPEELLNLLLPDDGRYVLIVEAADNADLLEGIDIGIEGQVVDGVRKETLTLNEIIDDRLFPGQPVEYSFTLTSPALLNFDSLEKDSRLRWTLDGPAGTIANALHFDLSTNSVSNQIFDLTPGNYKLTIDSIDDVAADYRFQMLNLLDAPQISSGETMTGEFVEGNETFVYRFDVAENQRFQFTNSITAVNALSQWRLIRPDGSDVTLPASVGLPTAGSRPLGTNQPEFSLPDAGEYFLLMEAGHSPHEGNQEVRVPSIFEFTVTVADAVPPTSIALGETVNGSIDFVGDAEVYTFTLSERTNLYVDALTVTGSTWTLTGPAGTQSPVRFDTTDSMHNADPVLNLASGDYSIRIDSNSSTGPFAFRILDISNSAAVTPGTPFSGELTLPNETDVYSFAASAGDKVFVDVVTGSDTSNTRYRLYTEYGQEVYESIRLEDSGVITIPADGTYTLLVEGQIRNEEQDTYTINLVPVVSTTQSLTLGSRTNGTLTTPGESAIYTFNLGDDTQLYFDVLTNDSNILWSLEGPRGEEIDRLRFDRTDSYDRVDASIDARAGDYRLTIEASGDHVGNYSFALLDLLNPAHTTTVSPNPGTANPSVSITPTPGLDALQSQVFRFTAAAGDELSFVTSVTGSINSYYRVIDANGIVHVPTTYLTTDRLNQTLTAGGTYFLLVEPRFNNGDVDDWSMDIDFVQNNAPATLTGTALTVGATTSGNLNTASQVDEYKFTVTERGNYYFDTLTNNSSIRWDLIGPTGTLVSNRTFTSTDAHNQTNVALDLVPGDYQIQIEASSGTPGASGPAHTKLFCR
ncbi:putative Ig domain-containing protein [Fuerstiella marisgermanici]|uniref:Ig domain protein n=1 Tax=Fuerstiella marisgermanici TaxID=1891926 RepID=A0A1P8WGC9_9PLAN|nr:putative Ig domain-containing protein [Fuerstiella marisgermanici]APZ93100.1 Putative Ig domain protein [Fuerstiella marisgermanici]